MSSEYTRLTAWFGERDRSGGAFLADRILAVIATAGLEHSVVLRGSEGFGSKHRLQSSNLLTLSEDLPLIVVGGGRRHLVDAAAGEIRKLASAGLVTVEQAEDPSFCNDETTGLQVWLRRGQRLGSGPAHIAVVELLARHGATATVCLLGVDGTTGPRRERARFFSWNGSVPMLVLAAGGPEAISRSAGQIHDLLPGARIELIGSKSDPRGDGEHRLRLFGTESLGANGNPLHSTLVRTVRESGGSGASVLAGIYGYTGLSSQVRGDSLFQLRRRVPVLTEIVDTAENCDRWEDIARNLGEGRVAIARVPVTALRARDA